MTRTVAASEAKNRLGSLMGWVVETGEEVIVESRGQPTVVILPYSEYERVRDLLERERRAQALNRLRQLRAETLERNKDLSPEQGDALSDHFVRDTLRDMVDEGKVQHEG